MFSLAPLQSDVLAMAQYVIEKEEAKK